MLDTRSVPEGHVDGGVGGRGVGGVGGTTHVVPFCTCPGGQFNLAGNVAFTHRPMYQIEPTAQVLWAGIGKTGPDGALPHMLTPAAPT